MQKEDGHRTLVIPGLMLDLICAPEPVPAVGVCPLEGLRVSGGDEEALWLIFKPNLCSPCSSLNSFLPQLFEDIEGSSFSFGFTLLSGTGVALHPCPMVLGWVSACSATFPLDSHQQNNCVGLSMLAGKKKTPHGVLCKQEPDFYCCNDMGCFV